MTSPVDSSLCVSCLATGLKALPYDIREQMGLYARVIILPPSVR